MLRNPIYYSLNMRSHIDLSQLTEVSDPVGAVLYTDTIEHFVHFFKPDDPHYYVGFNYRYGGEWVEYRRPMHRGPYRNPDLSLVDPSEELRTLGEEYYVVVENTKGITLGPRYWEKHGATIVHHEKTDTLAVVRNLRAEHKRLINAWQKWKKAEPEIYAIIRKHLS